MTSTHSAAATGLPASIPALHEPMPRRSFLAGLTRLPLIGGSVALLGSPSAVAEPVTIDLMESYKTWLFYEHRLLNYEMARMPRYTSYYRGRSEKDIYEAIRKNHYLANAGGSYHHFDGSDRPSARAALVFSAVGCDWRNDESPDAWRVPAMEA